MKQTPFLAVLVCLFFVVMMGTANSQTMTTSPFDLPSNTTDQSVFDLSVPYGPFQIGEKIPFSIITPDQQPIKELKVKLAHEQSNLLQVFQKPTSTDGITWSGELLVLSDTVKSINPMSLTVTPINGEKSEAVTNTQDIQMIPISEDQASFGYADPIKPTVELRGYLIVGLIAFGILLLLFLLAYLIWVFLLKSVISTSSAQKGFHLSPIQELEKEFAILRKVDSISGDEIGAHYTKLSFLIRRYLERTGNYRALELTDDEMESLVRLSKEGLPIRGLSGFFIQCSSAKYAKISYTQQVILQDLETVETFIKAEKQRLHEEEVARKEAELAAKKSKTKVAA